MAGTTASIDPFRPAAAACWLRILQFRMFSGGEERGGASVRGGGWPQESLRAHRIGSHGEREKESGAVADV